MVVFWLTSTYGQPNRSTTLKVLKLPDFNTTQLFYTKILQYMESAGKIMSRYKIKLVRAAVKLAAKYIRQRRFWWWWLRAAERCEEVLLDKWLRWRLLGQRKRGRLNRRWLGTINNKVTRWCLKIEDTNDGRDGDQWKNLEARWTVTYQ